MFPNIQHTNIEACLSYAENLPDLPGVYILCFPDVNPDGKSRGHASHYAGAAPVSIRRRYIQHIEGKGGNVVRVSNARNGDAIPTCHYIVFSRPETCYAVEHAIKTRVKNGRHLCPVCGNGKRRMPLTDEQVWESVEALKALA